MFILCVWIIGIFVWGWYIVWVKSGVFFEFVCLWLGMLLGGAPWKSVFLWGSYISFYICFHWEVAIFLFGGDYLYHLYGVWGSMLCCSARGGWFFLVVGLYICWECALYFVYFVGIESLKLYCLLSVRLVEQWLFGTSARSHCWLIVCLFASVIREGICFFTFGDYVFFHLFYLFF